MDLLCCRPGAQTVNGKTQGPPKASHFTFDSVHGPQASQQAVFGDAESIVTSVLDGYRCLPLQCTLACFSCPQVLNKSLEDLL